MDASMTETTPEAAQPAGETTPPSGQAPGKPAKKEDNFFVFLVKLVVIVVIFRSFFFSPFNIPSESMLPRLQKGDYLLAAKWPYGFSEYSLPFSLPLIQGRIFASEPKRGDVAIFKAPPAQDVDYIKRVIGLPGDTLQMIDGVLYLNGVAVPKERIGDFVVPVTPNTDCYMPIFRKVETDGSAACHYPQFRETLPNGVSYNVIDFGHYAYKQFDFDPDNTQPYVVPAGHFFAMGDNRDNSMDSRFPAVPGKGIGIVPQENLVGRATIMMFSTDGSASWYKPWTWFTAARWSRIGGTF
jgi:signal peptidase I